MYGCSTRKAFKSVDRIRHVLEGGSAKPWIVRVCLIQLKQAFVLVVASRLTTHGRCRPRLAPKLELEVILVRLLVVEDEQDLATAVAAGLRQEGYAVDVAGDGAEALDRLSYTPYDLVLLDLAMPRVDGWGVLRDLRSDAEVTGTAPPRVLLLTARDSLRDRVRGLDDGADDYLVKPFAFTELAARVRALLRRDSRGTSSVLTVGDLVLDTASHAAYRGNREVALSVKEFALLRYFMLNAGRVISSGELIEHVWDETVDPTSSVTRVTIGTLRRKLAPAVLPDAAEQPLETVVGVGYRLRVA
jgi:DNA-binding response OmpR family regulator